MAWNSLPDSLLDPVCSSDCFWWDLKNFSNLILLAYASH